MPERHPDDDLLADLAADVLPADRARAVEAHVLACDRCTGLLEDAERVRSLLLSGDPGPVPTDVWNRIEAALAAEAAPAQGASAGPDHAGDTAAFKAFVDTPTGPHRVVPLPVSHDSPSGGSRDSLDSRSPEAPAGDGADWAGDADPLDDPVRWGGGRPATGGGENGSSRRDARADSRRRRGPLLLAAAAVLAIVAVTGSVKLLGRSSPSEASLSAGAAQNSQSASAGAGGTAQAPIVRSGRDYRAKTLAVQASALLPRANGAASTTTGGTPGPAGSIPSPRAVAPGASRAPAAAVPPDTTADDITNPTRLAACLDALGVSRDRLVAVDLATYEGREAAILLLNAADGNGHEVWAVERTCARGAEGALKYTRVTQ